MGMPMKKGYKSEDKYTLPKDVKKSMKRVLKKAAMIKSLKKKVKKDK